MRYGIPFAGFTMPKPGLKVTPGVNMPGFSTLPSGVRNLVLPEISITSTEPAPGSLAVPGTPARPSSPAWFKWAAFGAAGLLVYSLFTPKAP